MKLEKSKIWALWGMLTISYTYIFLMIGNIEPTPYIGFSILGRFALWNLFCLHFLFNYTGDKNEIS